MNRIVIILLLLVLPLKYACAQDSSAHNYTQLDKSYLSSYWHGGINLVKSPVYWRGKQWIALGVSAVTLYTLLEHDSRIRNFTFNESSEGRANFATVFEPIGNKYVQIGLYASLFLGGSVFKNQRSKHLALQGAKAFIFTAGATKVLHLLTNRSRPTAFNSSYDFAGPGFYKDRTAFSSGHAALAFSLATLLTMEYSTFKWMPYLAYGLASLTALSRIEHRKHWASDVFVGALIGHYVTRYVLNISKGRKRDLTLSPVLHPEISGIYCSLRF